MVSPDEKWPLLPLLKIQKHCLEVNCFRHCNSFLQEMPGEKSMGMIPQQNLRGPPLPLMDKSGRDAEDHLCW